MLQNLNVSWWLKTFSCPGGRKKVCSVSPIYLATACYLVSQLEAYSMYPSLQHKFLPPEKPFEWSTLIDRVTSIFFDFLIFKKFYFQSTLAMHVHERILGFVFLMYACSPISYTSISYDYKLLCFYSIHLIVWTTCSLDFNMTTNNLFIFF